MRVVTNASAAAILPVLLILYPLLLLLDSVEPGFVRSVINPHAFLLVLVVMTTLIPGDGRVWLQRTITVFALVAAVVVGGWVWWSVGRETLGMVVGLLSAVAVFAILRMLNDASRSPSSF